MKIKKALLSGLFAASCLTMAAQEEAATTTENVFNPHWYIQGQIGGQETLGEIGFSDLLSPNAQIGVGYNFSSVFGLRLAANAWQSKAGWDINNTEYKWKWNYVAPALSAHFNLTNLFCGFNPNRVVNVGIFGGVGANIAFSNDEASAANTAISAAMKNTYNTQDALVYLWGGTKTRLLGQFGLTVDFRLSNHVSLGIELQANTLNDHYNSKRANNSDWYFNGLVGIKYAFGKTHSTREVEIPTRIVYRDPEVVEKVVEKVVEVPVEQAKEASLRRDIFFTISNTKIATFEMQKVKEIADFMKENPKSTVHVTGYADKGTGNATINEKLASKRAAAVVKALTDKYGISADRIVTSSKGDTEQPYAEGALNRVAICIAE
jgi:outer membrane protein OmpA-like peptidoglycan-associated protein